MNNDSKTIALASYITPIGWFIAIVARYLLGESNQFVVFHLRQGLGLNLLWLLAPIIHLLGNWIITQLTTLVLALACIYCVVNASKGECIYVPFVGRFFNAVFTFIR